MTASLQGLYAWYRQTIRNPKYRWWLILGTLAYLVFPLDLAPDFIPVIGQLDDALLITLLFTEVSQVLIERVKNQKTAASDAANSATSEAETPVDVRSVVID